MQFLLTENPIDPIALRQQLLAPSAGAYCSYEGWVRDHNRGQSVVALDYYGYPQLAPAIAQTLLAEAAQQFKLVDAAIVHRIGALRTGDIAVWVGVTAHHRDDTFLACRYLIDQVKHRLPIWKKERYRDGSEAWIQSNHCDAGAPDQPQHQAP